MLEQQLIIHRLALVARRVPEQRAAIPDIRTIMSARLLDPLP
jgi:hypothetical protein